MSGEEHDMRTHWKTQIGVITALLSLGLGMLPLPARALEVGDKAPDFLMHSTREEAIRLSDYQGKKNVVLFFSVAAFTGTH
jgi:hypothetical protein